MSSIPTEYASDFDAAKPPSAVRCLELQRVLGRGSVPPACERYLSHVDKQKEAWSGAPLKYRISGTASSWEGQHSYHKLQRRFSDGRTQNPWCKEDYEALKSGKK